MTTGGVNELIPLGDLLIGVEASRFVALRNIDEARRIYAYRSLTEVREFTDKDELSDDEVLPGFSTPVADLFEL